MKNSPMPSGWRRISILACFFATGVLSARGAELTVEGRLAAPAALSGGVTIELLAAWNDYQAGTFYLKGQGNPEPVASVRSDEQGYFRLQVPEAGLWWVVVRSPQYVPLAYPLFPLVESRVLPPATLEPAKACRVRVVDESGTAIPGAWLAVGHIREPAARPQTFSTAFDRVSQWTSWRQMARTDGEGWVKLPRSSRQELKLTVHAPGFAEGKGRCGDQVRITLRRVEPPERRIRIVQESGAPVGGALVRAGKGRWTVAMSDADGWARVEESPAPPVEILLAQGLRVNLPSPDATRVQVPELVMQHVHVVSRPDRVSLGGAYLWLDTWRRSRLPRRVTVPMFFPSDAAGRVVLEVAASSPLTHVRAVAPGHFAGSLALDAAFLADPAVLALRRSTTLSGRLLDEEGWPVEDGEVAVTWGMGQRLRPRDFPLFHARSDPQGRFEVGGLPAGMDLLVKVSKEGFAPIEIGSSRISARGQGLLEIVLTRGRVVTGVARNHLRERVPGAQVALVRPRQGVLNLYRSLEESHYLVSPVVYTAVDGRFTIPNIRPGTYDLLLQAPGYASLRVPQVQVPHAKGALELGDHVLEVGAQVEGRVVNGDGRAVQDIAVMVAKDRARGGFLGSSLATGPLVSPTDAQILPGGRFRVDTLKPGERVNFGVDASGYIRKLVEGVEAPTLEPLVIVLDPAYSISGKVVDEDQSGLSGAVVEARADGVGSSSGLGSRQARSNGDGDFSLADLAPGRIVVSAFAPGFEKTTVVVDLAQGEDVEDLKVVLEPATGEVVGRVSAAGRALPGAQVSVRAQGATLTDAEGGYRLRVPSGRRRTITVSHPDFEYEAQKQFLVRSGLNRVNLRFDRIPVSGSVLDTTGRLVDEVHITLHDDVQRRFYDGRSIQGRFHLEVPAGEYRITAGGHGFRETRRDQTLIVRNEAITGVEIEIGEYATVVGKITGLTPEETARVVVHVGENSFAPKAFAQVSPDGAYRAHIPPGAWTVVARVRGSAKSVAELVEIRDHGAEKVVDLEFGSKLRLDGTILVGGKPGRARILLAKGNDQSWVRQVHSDSKGRFLFQDLDAGSYSLHAENQQRTIELSQDQSISLEIELGSILGSLFDSSTSQPVSGTRLLLTPSSLLKDEARAIGLMRTAWSDGQGQFHFGEVPAGDYLLTITSRSYFEEQHTLQVRPHGTTNAVIRLSRSD